MSAPGGIRRNFSNFKGLNQSVDDLTRPVEFADEATNVEITRKGSIAKRPGAKSQTFVTTNSFHGLYSHVFSNTAAISGTRYSYATTATTNSSYTPPTGSTINWVNPSNVTTLANYATLTVPTTGTLYSNYIVINNFSFDIPDENEITGISIRLFANTTTGTCSIRPIFAVTLDGGITLESDVVQSDYVLDTTTRQFHYHEPQSTYGVQTLTPAVVNSSGFGIAFRLRTIVTSTPLDIQLIWVQVSVHYRQAKGTQQETKLYSCGKLLEEHSKGTIKIVYSPSGGGTPPPAKLFILPNTATNQYKVDLQVNDVSISGFPKYYNQDTLPALIEDLHNDINATSDFYMETTPAGNLGATATNQNYVYAPGHTFTNGQTLTIWSQRYRTNTSRHILGVDGDYIYLDGNVTSASGTAIGVFNQLVAAIPEQDGLLLPANDTTAGIIEVPWQVPTNNVVTSNVYKILQGDTVQNPQVVYEEEPFISAQVTHGVDDINTSFVSKNGNLYFGVPFYLNTGNAVRDSGELVIENSGLWKYDGRDTYLAGMPSIDTPDTMAVTSLYGNDGMTPNSTYKFRYQYCYRDYRGNFIEGPLSDEIAVQTNATDLNAFFTWDNPRAHRAPFAWRGILANNDSAAYSVTPTTQIWGNEGVPYAGGDLIGNVLPGTEVVLYDFSETQWKGKFVTRTITESISDSLGTTFFLDEPVSRLSSHASMLSFRHHCCVSQIRIRVWRTVADGSLFYFCTDLPAINIPGISAANRYSFYDGTPDSDLGEPLIEPDRRPSLFPAISTLSIHQGLIVASGNPEDPETIYFEDQIVSESSPAASSSFRVVGSKSSGPITAHASDNDDMLAVFKNDHYFNVVGDLDSLSFQVLEVSKGDYGCPAHAAIVKVDNTLIFPSNTGFKAIAGGQLITDFNDVFVDDFLGNEYVQVLGEAIAEADRDKFVLRRAVATYIPETQQYVCFIPCESGIPGFDGSRESNENSRIFVFHRKHQAWTKWQMSPDLNMAGGITMYLGKLYWAARRYNESTYAMMWGKLYRQRCAGNARDFLDETQPIEMRLRMTWDSLDNPADYFNPVFLKLYQFNEEDFLTPFDLTIKEYRNYNESTVYTQASRAFNTAADKEKRLKFKSGRASAVSVEFYNNTAEQKPVLTGYEYEVRNPYLPRIKAGRNR